MITRRFLTVATTVLSVLAGVGFAQAQEPIKVRLAMLSPGLGPARVKVAEAQGFFKKHGLDVQITVFRASPEAATAVVTGSIDMAESGASPVLNARARGLPLKAFFIENDAPYYYLLSSPNIQSLQDAVNKGASVGVSGVGSSDYGIARYIFRKAGLDPNKLKYVAAGSNAQRVAAVEAGRVEVAIAGVPEIYDFLRSGKVKQLGAMGDYSKHLSIETMWATEDYIAKNGEAIKRFLAALDDASNWIKADHERAAKSLLDYLGYKHPQAVEDIQRAFKEINYPTVADHKERLNELLSGLEPLVSDAIEQGVLKAGNPAAAISDMVDMRYVK